MRVNSDNSNVARTGAGKKHEYGPNGMNPLAVLTADEMRAVESAAIKGGVASAALMEAAGKHVADIAMRAWSKRPVAVICGPGNNGGDGYVAARLVKAAGWPVKVLSIGDPAALKGDAKLMAEVFDGEIAPFEPSGLEGAALIIDAIFGTGLARAVEGAAKAAIETINAHPAPALAVDLPSGVGADDGAVFGAAVEAARTVTFHAKKPGHLLFPGRALSGAVDVVDIGIKEGTGAATAFENHPGLWAGVFPRPSWQGHKYARGHVMCVSGGPLNTGAARLAANGALRIGAGLVTMLSPSAAAPVHAAHLTAIMLREANSAEDIARHMRDADKSRLAVVIGPAAGVGAATRDNALAVLNSRAGAVLDADALTSFADDRDLLFSALRADDVLTPHTGEFARLFAGETGPADKLAMTRAASRRAGCVVVLKGPDTVIAAPDGRAAINANAPPDLATAGAGDVLAGFIAGLKAQGMAGFAAAAAGVWFHGACGQAAGPGLVAEDLAGAVPAVLRSLLAPPTPTPAPEEPQ